MSIIIFGEIGAGKDTVAEMFAKELNGEIAKLGKRIRNDVDELYDIIPQKHNRRKLYQDYGQGMRKVFGEDVWNLILHNSIKDGIDKGNVYIIADARQSNEFTYWTNIGFIPVAVVADEHIRKHRIQKRDGFDQSANFNHETEINARKITQKIKDLEPTGRAFTIVNNGTLDELSKTIATITSKIKQFSTVGSLV